MYSSLLAVTWCMWPMKCNALLISDTPRHESIPDVRIRKVVRKKQHANDRKQKRKHFMHLVEYKMHASYTQRCDHHIDIQNLLNVTQCAHRHNSMLQK